MFVLLALVAPLGAAEPNAQVALRKGLEGADEAAAVPGALGLYSHLRSGLDGTLQVGADEPRGDFHFSRKVTAAGELVFSFSSGDPRVEHATDIITRSGPAGLLKRVRLMADGSIERLTGVVAGFADDDEEPKAFESAQHHIQWFGEVERDGEPTGETVVALEVVRSLKGEFFHQRSLAWSRQVIRDDQVVRRESFGFRDFEKIGEPAVAEEEPSGLGGLLKTLLGKRDAEPAEPEPATEAEPVVHEFAKLNFRFTHPEGRYVRMDAAAVSPDATLTLMQARPGRMFMIIAEEFGEVPTFNLDSLAHVVRSNMRSVNAAVQLGEIETLERDGVPHRRFSTEAPLQNGKTGRWCHLVSLRKGFAYQLVLFSMEAGQDELVGELDELAVNFELIDPNRVARNAGMAPPSRYEAPAFGLRLDAAEANTIPWDPRDLAANFPAASFGVISLSGGGLFVVPADLGGIDPSPAVLARVLRALAGLGPETAGMQVEDHVQGTGVGTKATACYDFQGTRYTHQVRVLRNRGKDDGADRALAIAAFGPGEGAEVTAKLEALLDLVEITAPSGGAPPASATQADIANQFGLALHGRGDARAAIPFYEEARRRAPGNAIYGLNLLLALNDSGRFEQGLAEVEAMLAAVDSPGGNLRSWQATFLGAVGRHPEGIEIYDELFREGWRNDDDLLKYLQMLSAAGEVERALAVIDDYIGEHRITSLNVRRWRGELLSQAGRWEEALEAARALAGEHPDDVGLRVTLVSALIDTERGAEALELLDQGDFGTTDEAVLLYHRGRALNAEREFVRAKECLEKAAAAMPMLPGVQDELDLAAAMLGHGDQGAIRTPLEPVAIPAGLAAALEPYRAGGAGGSPGFSHRVDLAVTGIHFDPGSPLRRTEHREVTVLNRAGLEDYRNIRFTFDPSRERAHVNRLEVLDAEGRVTSTGNPADYYVSSGTGGLVMATGERTVTAPVPGLSIGDRIRYSYTVETRAAIDEPPFERLLLATLMPSGPRAVFVTGAPDGLRGVVVGGDATTTGGDGHRYWLLPEPPRFEFEELLPDLDRFLPSLVLGPASGSWEELGRDYLETIADRLEAAPEVRERAAEFLREHPGEEERVGAILRFVQTGVTYQAIEFGRRARIPNKAEACLRDRYGDCKDHSLLAHLLLRESGIPSQLVLVNTAATIEAGLPSLDQFDHMILRVGGRAEGRFHDCTAKHGDPSWGPGSALAGRRGLVLFDDGPALATVSGAGGIGNRVATGRTVRYEPAGNEFKVHETTRFRGEQAEWVRSYFSGTDRFQYGDVLTRLLGSDHRLRIDEVEIEGLDPHDPELVIVLDYRITSALHHDGGSRSGDLPAVWEELYFKSGAAARRKAPFELRAAYDFESTCTFELAGDPAAAGAPSWKPAEADHPWGKWGVSVDGTRRVARLKVDRGVFPKESFSDYRADQSAFLKALRGRLTLRDPSSPAAGD